MKDYYTFFTKQDILLARLHEVYLEFYAIKKEFYENKDVFLKEYLKDLSSNTINESNINENTPLEKEYTIFPQQNPIYHRLVILTHPDKKNNSKMEPLYQYVKEANEKHKFAKLCFFAQRMNVPIGTLTEEECKEIESVIHRKKEKIRHYEKTFPVQFSRAKTKEIQEKLLATFKELDNP